MRLTHEAINNITPELWPKEVIHVLKIEEQMWQLDGLIDVEVDKLVISVDGESTDTETWKVAQMIN